MNSFTPGIIIALLIMFLVGILVGYSLVQKRSRKHTEELKVSQRRLAEMEQSHELRLREATEKLRQDYETQLAGTIEHYQDQLSQKTVEMEQVYETRFRVLQQGGNAAIATESSTANASNDQRRAQSAIAGESAYQLLAEPDVTNPAPMSQSEPSRLEQQYERQLQMATQELEQAYETRLAEQMAVAKADLQTNYEQQLATKYREFEQTFADRQSELEQQLATLQAEAALAQEATLASEIAVPTPSEIMGTGNETTMSLMTNHPPADMATSPSSLARYTQTEVDQQIAVANQQAAAEFEQRLTEQLEAQQILFDRRYEALEADYQQRLSSTMDDDATTAGGSAPLDDLLVEDGYEDLVSDLGSEFAAPGPTAARQDLDLDLDDLQADSFVESSAEPMFDENVRTEAMVSEIEADLFGEEDALTEPPRDEVSSLEDAAIAFDGTWLSTTSREEDLADLDANQESALSNDEALFDETASDLEEVETSEALSTDSFQGIADPAIADLDVDWFSDDDLATTTEPASLSNAAENSAIADPEDSLLGDDDLAEALPPADDHSLEADSSTIDLEVDLEDDLFGDDDLVEALPPPDNNSTTADLEDDWFGDDDLFAGTPPPPSSSEDALTEAENELFGENGLFAETPSPPSSVADDFFGEDDLFADPSPKPPGSDEENRDDDDDDDFGPLDLSDISQLT